MSTSLIKKCRDYLIKDLNGTQRGKYIQEIKCPSCSYYEAWCEADRPWKFFCQRKDKCGIESSLKQLRPDLFRFEPQKNISNSDLIGEYLKFRGIDFTKFQNKIEEGEAVREEKKEPLINFKLENGDLAGRLITYQGKDKAHFPSGSTPSKTIYAPINLDFAKELWITEGPIDALSLCQVGYQSISVLSANYKPENNDWIKDHIGKFKEVILAFDSDKAGFKASENWFKYCQDNKIQFKIASPPKGQDWNDLLVIDSLTQEEIDKALSRGELTKLEIENNPLEYFVRIRGEYPQKIFIFREKTYFGFLKEDIPGVSCILRGILTANLVKISGEGFEMEKQTIFNLKVPENNTPFKVILDAQALTKPERMKEILMARARVIYAPYDNKAHIELVRHLIKQPSKEIRGLDFFGYDQESDSFVFYHFAIKEGKVYYKDSNGHISGVDVMPFKYLQSIKKIGVMKYQEFWELIYESYGEKGLLITGFWIASYLRDYLIGELGFFPFCSFYGDPTTGKTCLARSLNTAFSFDTKEGISVGGTSTKIGALRSLSQRRGLVTAISEFNKNAKNKLDDNDLKQLYDGMNSQKRASKSNDNKINESEMHSSLAFTANAEPSEDPATKERFISYRFSVKDITNQSALAFNTFMELSRPNHQNEVPISSIGLQTLEKLEKIKSAFFPKFKTYSDILNVHVGHRRIANNYALPLAMIAVISEIFNLNLSLLDDCLEYSKKVAKEKLTSCRQNPEIAEDFLETLKGYNPGTEFLKEGNLLYVNHTRAFKSLRINPIERKELREALKLVRGFKEIKKKKIPGTKESPWWYVFELPDWKPYNK